ncbi:MAG: tRNA uridine-5-carboxymethylaminomethyl(34) synthesis GTPase MnmE, partial [Hungatella sp.]
MKTDTIAAIATAMSSSGIGIIRISGEEAFAILRQIFRGKNHKTIEILESHTVHYGHIYDGDDMMDEVLVLVMKGPHS